MKIAVFRPFGAPQTERTLDECVLFAALAGRGHHVVFFERTDTGVADDAGQPRDVRRFSDTGDLDAYLDEIAEADAVLVSSEVAGAAALTKRLGTMVTRLLGYLDADTPKSLAALDRGGDERLSPDTLALYDLYLASSGGPYLERLATRFGVTNAYHLGASADTLVYRPVKAQRRFDLGYYGDHDPARADLLETLFLAPARELPKLRFGIAGAGHVREDSWPENVELLDPLPAAEHAKFYGSLRFALYLSSEGCRQSGFTPDRGLFGAVACGVPVISDDWEGIEAFLVPGHEVLIAEEADDITSLLTDRSRLGRRVAKAGRERIFAEHSARERAQQLESLLQENMISGTGAQHGARA